MRLMSHGFQEPSLRTRVILIPAGIRNHTPREVWDEIIYPSQNVNGCTIDVYEWYVISSHTLQ